MNCITEFMSSYPIILTEEELEAVARVRDILGKHLGSAGQKSTISGSGVNGDGKAFKFILIGERK